MSRPSQPVSIPACVTFGFSLLLTCVSAVALVLLVDARILPTIPRFDPRAELKVRRNWELWIDWKEDAGWNHPEKSKQANTDDTWQMPIAVDDGWLYFEVTESALDFDLIEKHAGWPPKKSTPGWRGEGGMVEYHLTVKDALNDKKSSEVEMGYAKSRKQLYVRVRRGEFQGLPVRLNVEPSGCKWFEASADGFVKLANMYQKKEKKK